MKHRNMMAIAACSLLAAVSSLLAQDGAQSPPPEVPPRWVQTDWADWTQGTGRWITDNRANQSSSEPYDAYGMEWKYGLGKKSLHGRLFAMQAGKEVGTVWEFRSLWHPGRKKLLVSQVASDGTLATGVMTALGSNQTESLERFFSPDGKSFQIGHRTVRKGDEMHIQSYDVSESGVWTERRSYVWKLQK